MKKVKFKESDLLSKYDIALTNTEKNELIGERLAANGYHAEALAEGRKLLEDATAIYKTCQMEREGMFASHDLFESRRNELDAIFDIQRKKARVVFRGDNLAFEKLALTGRYPQRYAPWIASATKFYEGLQANPELLDRLKPMGITEETVQNALALINDVIAAYAAYTNMKGNSQKHTQLKEEAFNKISDWMRDFYAIAKIAFHDQPQQIESFGIVVKS